MATKRYKADADNTIVSAYQPNLETRGTGSNTGRADVVEVFSIYGRQQASSSTYLGSQELSRILMKFPISQISTDRTNSVIPASGSVNFYLRLFNAEHSKTVPRDITLMIYPVSQSWQEGTGLDLINYADLTKGRPGSNWMSASNTSAWGATGGAYVSASNQWDHLATLGAPPIYSQSFATGLEDLEVNITPLVEVWLDSKLNNYGVGIQLTSSQEAYYDTSGQAAIAASGSIQFNSETAADYDDETFTVNSTDGTEVVYTLDDDTGTNTYGASTTNIGIQGGPNAAWIANKAHDAIANSSNAHSGKITVSISTDTLTLTQATSGQSGNNTIATSDSTDMTVLGFAGGVNQGAILPITGGATTSYYTKRFFARGTQYFFKRPVIEARWNSTKNDDRGNFYYSSSLAPAEDNLNTLYLYNYVRGRLRNIPAIGTTGSIMVSIYSGSSGDVAPSSSKLLLYNSKYAITGGYVETGVYSASIGVTASTDAIKTLYDVWWSGSTNQPGGAHRDSASAEFATGSITPITTGSVSSFLNHVRIPTYFINITNLRNKYNTSETVRFNLYVREKNWNPTVYAKASTTAPNTSIRSASYRVFRLMDGLEAIPHGTGSDYQTGISYDISGNYFDFDMGLLDGGYSYGFKFAFNDSELSTWTEQDKVFKFRVEDYEY